MDAHAYAVWHGHGAEAAAYSSWYVENHTSDENAGWDNLPQHPASFAGWIGLP